MRTMYDSVNAASIPADAEMVAGYGNGDFKWSDAAWDRFPNARHVHIDVLGTDPEGCGVGDVESGAMTLADVPAWIRARLAHGRAVIYCSRSTMASVQEAAAGLSYSIWCADWTGEPHEVDGAIAVQYENDVEHDRDVTAVYDDSWHSG